ncbi:MAG: hypothetical protein AB7D00_00795 [Rhodospirillaceae bacterium]
MTRAVLVTSLNPAADATQDAAVASWLGHGFSVISHNVAAEAARLAPRYPAVAFRAPERTATAKRLPLIGGLIAEACAEAPDLCAIVNADIVLRPGTEIVRRLRPPLGNALVAVARTDVDDLASLANPALARGFDAFFFGPGLAAILDERPFCIGMPNWDYWLPLAAWAAGWALSSITAPVALHPRHETRWSDKTLSFNHHLMRYLFSQRFPDESFLPASAAEYEDLAFRALRDATLPPEERAAAIEALAALEDKTMSAMLRTLRAAMPEFQPGA